jgi:outer membrane biogenesis lipoprotein LolB
MRTNFILILLVCSALLNSCTNEDTSPDPTSQITNKWWCAKAGTGTISSQYFKADGTWEQGSKGGRFNDTGKWALSANKKKIVISSVLDYNKKSKTGWEYDMETFSETSLKMNWSAFGVIMDLEVCK